MAEETDAKEELKEEETSGENSVSESTETEKKEKTGKKESRTKKDTKEDKEVKKLKKEIEKYASKLEEAEKEVAELKDQYLRKQADFENFRKRMFREKEDSIKFANTSLLNDLIGTIDDFERALQSSEDSKDFDAFHSGVEMIEKQLLSMLDSNWGLKRFESAGEPFDPSKHEALMMEDSAEYDVQTVIEDYVKGYILHDRVIRPAKVKVGNPAPVKEEETTT
ncbi:MAG: nucleotide exchange factor GrpE [Spirochaetales bacterium]|nr:nucleotide exchange factor GrpE [Spirochaetales bacterium]